METKETEFIYSERNSKKQFFDKRLIEHIVRLVEQGVPRRDILEEYGMSQSTLVRWMARYGSRASRKVYSQSEKRSVVRAIEAGMSIKEAQVTFGITWSVTIKRWIREFEQEFAELSDPNPIEVAKKTTPEGNTAEVEAMKKALAEANLKIKALDTMIDIAEQRLKIEIRKKSGARQSSK
jgi:transposase